jgi:hypothetical protein
VSLSSRELGVYLVGLPDHGGRDDPKHRPSYRIHAGKIGAVKRNDVMAETHFSAALGSVHGFSVLPV